MRPVDYLPRLQRQAIRRLVLLKESLPRSPYGVDYADVDRRVAFATIEAANVWTFYCRSFYLSCALGTKDRAGAPIRGGQHFGTTHDALWFAIQQVNPKARLSTTPWTPYDEPDWHQIGVFTKIMRALGPPNVSNVEGSIALTTDVFEFLISFRSFYAHRGEFAVTRARKAASRYLLASTSHPTAILMAHPTGSGDTVLRGWLDDLRIVIELMV